MGCPECPRGEIMVSRGTPEVKLICGAQRCPVGCPKVHSRVPKGAQEMKFWVHRGTQKCCQRCHGGEIYGSKSPEGEIWGARRCPGGVILVVQRCPGG